MKKIVFSRFPVLLMVIAMALPAAAGDMRELQIQAREARQTLIRDAAAEKAAAEAAAAESRARIMKDRVSLEAAIAALESANRSLEKTVDTMDAEYRQLVDREGQLSEKLTRTDSMINELVGVIRVNAKDVDGLITQNLQSAMGGTPQSFLQAVAQESRFPGMDDVRALARGLLDQIETTSEVAMQKGTIIDRAGRDVDADVLLLGPFTAAYRIGDETGFCNYSAAGRKLYALSRLPTGRMQNHLERYMDGESDVVPMDISRGGALRQLTHELKLWEQVPKGGPIVWPILLILAVGILIVIERIIFLVRKHLDADGLVRTIESHCLKEDWPACETVCDRHANIPVARVVKAGLTCCDMQREEMENALQEAILREIPPMERFLSTLGMLAAIAPLMGLLGTVTGMIDTFHVITLHGTGDPRLMSGGISEALVTTMLGLTVAIPLMLSQTLLSRAVDKKIGEMEEKAVALVNIIHKSRGKR
ncbi:flagellar motor protein MotA [Desulfosarcina ovata subsp. sediminis]|uniref:Flagellar motor protein MotA n=1 Tax=Desulfosarcina ovata subsp. sediminis TaxID=885957 RepID=A0A5K7ZR16_9BACT|nr:MotA/TolQ/ExbB proton channel family protein [Desulfosarcina ovata]BBO82600.1 flagellar motor protein MotA [Desulfosarcina ovata subsp. sediminis]